MWPSPWLMEGWTDKTCCGMMKGNNALFSRGNGYFAFLLELKDNRDLIFRNGSYFFWSKGMHLNRWHLDFNPDDDIPSEIFVWMKLLQLPLSCWSDDCLKAIRNQVGKYLDRVELKGSQFTCVKIYVEVDMEKGLPSKINLSLSDWFHRQTLDYEKIPFKCFHCHEYGHFIRYFAKVACIDGQ